MRRQYYGKVTDLCGAVRTDVESIERLFLLNCTWFQQEFINASGAFSSS
jgi:hypothetical protein